MGLSLKSDVATKVKVEVGRAALRGYLSFKRHPMPFVAAGLAAGVVLGACPRLRRGLAHALEILIRM